MNALHEILRPTVVVLVAYGVVTLLLGSTGLYYGLLAVEPNSKVTTP